jgi:hypothetical protein
MRDFMDLIGSKFFPQLGNNIKDIYIDDSFAFASAG